VAHCLRFHERGRGKVDDAGLASGKGGRLELFSSEGLRALGEDFVSLRVAGGTGLAFPL
jgi:hypothetical protein